MRNNQNAASLKIEALENRQYFSAMGTMNVIDAGETPSLVTSYVLNGTKDYADAGVLNWTRSSGNPGTYAGRPHPGQTFASFCIEPDQEFPSGTNVGYTVTDLASAPAAGAVGAAKADEVRELWGRFRSTIGTDGTKAAALQMAIWEIVTDTGHNMSAGKFLADGASSSDVAIRNQAQSWLNQLNGTGPKANLLALSSATDQDLVFEVPSCSTKALTCGMAATIGFWHNKNGQALLNKLNGGSTATNLGNWLASNFSNLWGANAGANNLTGKTNAQIAAFFQTKFNVTGQKLDAQLLAVAFACYATNSNLAGAVAGKYGFKVDAEGTASATINVGSSGAAMGVKNNTNISVWQALVAANDLSAGGTGAAKFDPYNGNQALRNQANTVFSYINEHGDI